MQLRLNIFNIRIKLLFIDHQFLSLIPSKKPKKMVKIYLQEIKRGLHLQPLTTAKFIVTVDGDDKARG
jgi:hypothetical protein